MKKLSYSLSLLIFLCCWQTSLARNSKMVIGAESYAKECYQASQRASAKLGFVGSEDIDICNEAIFSSGLKQSDVVATYVNRGIIYASLNKLPKAVKDYNHAISIDERAGEAYINRGNLWFMFQQYAEAILDYNKAIDFGVSKLHVAYLNRGMAFEAMGKLEHAKQNYQAAIDQAANIELLEWAPAKDRIDRVRAKQAGTYQPENVSAPNSQ